MKLIIREKKELLNIEDYELRQTLDFGFFLFEFLAFDFNKSAIRSRASAENTIKTLNEVCNAAIEISELFFFLLWQEIERDCQSDDIPFPIGIREKLNDFLWAFDDRPTLEDCNSQQLTAFEKLYSAAISRFKDAQKIFSFACEFCCDVDYNKYNITDLTPQQKWYIFSHSIEFSDPLTFVRQFADVTEETAIVQPGELFYSDSLLHSELNEASLYIEEPLRILTSIEKYRMLKLESLKIFNTDSLFGLIYSEFWNMVTNGVHIKRCQHCGKYFIPFSENSEYCARIYKDKGKTCKDYAPMVIHRRKIQQDELLSVFVKAKNARYMRHRRNPALYTREKFDEWLAGAKEALARARGREINLEELRELLQK
jgi:hypothetical protein